ncbi:MAG: hypothetical protein HKN27_08785 [Silicimonas sp.]|nr:hypothetical protein [Silicimonas sp.]
MRRAAILGLGGRGQFWLKTALRSGWQVSGFDPDPAAMPANRHSEWQRENTISGTVKDADWIMCCLPERLELMQKVIQRAQAEAPEACIIAVDTRFDVEDVQSCAMRRGQLVQVTHDAENGFALSVTALNEPAIKEEATATLAEFAAIIGIEPTHRPAEQADASEQSA